MQVSKNMRDRDAVTPFKEWVKEFGFKGKDRIIFLLAFDWEMTMAEIGEILGVTESRICQKVKEISETIKEKSKWI